LAVKLKQSATDAVRLRLNHPREAKFREGFSSGLFDEVRRVKDSGDTEEYVVTGEVQAKNSFGATFTHQYTVGFTYYKETNTYEVKYCTLD